MYLFFDTETTGLPKNYQAPLDDFSNWPRLVQIAWSLYDAEGNHWGSHCYVIKPDGFVIPEEVAKIHRVSQERAEREGVPLQEALDKFINDVKTSSYIVAHNIDFDHKIVGSEFLRMGKKEYLDNMNLANQICTMKSSVHFCKISNGRGSYKWPNLTELYRSLFATNFSDAHDALVDVNACARCFFELKKKNVILK
ncbi:MAG: 3'-5' exonuclease [Patescibacteria group bacterium]|nr:3'-5' exonuclease [Patescibacteria group bacterium]